MESREDDFVLMGFDHTVLVCLTWFFSVLLIVEISRSVLIMGFFLVWDLASPLECLLMRF